MSADPSPLPRVQELFGRTPAHARLAWRLSREPLLSRARRMAIAGAAAYVASPVDLVPGIIPLVGQLDDVAVALLAIRFALAGLDSGQRRALLGEVGLEEEDIRRDLATVGATSAWLLRSGRGRRRRRSGLPRMAGAAWWIGSPG